MRLVETDLPGVLVLEAEKIHDERGFFARIFDEEELRKRGLHTTFPQHSISFSAAAASLRGLHYQEDPHAEVKIVRCIAGSIWDVAVDLRRQSPAFRRWVGVELSAANHRAVYVPRGFAHGFVTLTDGAEVQYLISESYRPELARGVRWDDPAFGIRWPMEPLVISSRDASYPDFALP